MTNEEIKAHLEQYGRVNYIQLIKRVWKARRDDEFGPRAAKQLCDQLLDEVKGKIGKPNPDRVLQIAHKLTTEDLQFLHNLVRHDFRRKWLMRLWENVLQARYIAADAAARKGDQ